jgi:outer membrane protein assembly factor BamB
VRRSRRVSSAAALLLAVSVFAIGTPSAVPAIAAMPSAVAASHQRSAATDQHRHKARKTCIATAHDENAAHTGFSCATLPTRLHRHWRVTLQGQASYPLIVGGRVFVTSTDPDGSYGGLLYALSVRTGRTLWGPVPLSGTYFYDALAYGDGRVFVNDFDGTVRAFKAATGAQVWARTTDDFSGEPVAAGGKVWLQSGSTVYGLDEKTGRVTAKSHALDGDGAAVAATAKAVYVSTGCTAQYRLGVRGGVKWSDHHNCTGGGGGTAYVDDGRFYGSDGYLVMNTTHGKVVSTFAGVPAFDRSRAYFAAGTNFHAQRLSDQAPVWTTHLKTTITDGPIVTSKAVYIVTSAGKLVVINPATGRRLSRLTLASAPTPGDQYSSTPSDIAAGDASLIVPTGDTVTAYGAKR